MIDGLQPEQDTIVSGSAAADIVFAVEQSRPAVEANAARYQCLLDSFLADYLAEAEAYSAAWDEIFRSQVQSAFQYASLPENLWFCRGSFDQASTMQTYLESPPPRWEGLPMEDPLPRLPLSVRPITLTLEFRGRGKPRFRAEAEISLYDDD